MFPARSIGDHSTDALALLPPCAPHHPVAQERPQERDGGEAERDEQEGVVSPSQAVIDICEEEDGEVKDDRQQGGKEEQAGRMGELPLARHDLMC